MKRDSTTNAGSASLLDLLRNFAPEIRAQRRWIVGSLVVLFAEVGLRLLEPWPIKVVFDSVLKTKHSRFIADLEKYISLTPMGILTAAAVALVMLTGLRALAAYWNTVGFAIVGSRVLASVRTRLFRHLHSLPLSFYNRSRSGDLVVRVISDVGLLQDVTVTALLPLAARLLIVTGMAGVMFWMNWQLAMLALALLPLFWLRTLRLTRSIREVAKQQRRREGAMAATAAETFSGMKIVQALAVADVFAEAFGVQNDKSVKSDVKGKRLAASLERSVDLLIAGATALVLWQGARFVLAGRLTPGELLVFLAYLKSAFRPVQDFAKFTGRLGKAGAAGARVIELLKAVPETIDRPGAIDVGSSGGEIRFENVSFAYEPGQPVLREASFVVRPGETLAILGESGNGKSTILNLLARLHEPTEGRIMLDGRDIRDYRVDSLRRSLGIVLQENVLFAGTVRDNIALGLPAATDEEVQSASRLANASNFITELRDGFDTCVGERGDTLSQGQRQRIAIARAAIRDTRILLFDEPTTGLDEANELAVIEGLQNLSRGRTTLWVTHNPRHAALADFVVRIESGRIVPVNTDWSTGDAFMEEHHAVTR
ncbi:ATP-binding cassette domain-containing protein [bacterium]|nr:ATP-binding cassette domain-containing protein [bacterium]